LQAVLGYSRLLSGGRLDAAMTTQAIQAIDRNARVQVALIEDLLDMSRVITGKFTIDVRPVELSALAEAALDTVRLAAEAKGITLSAAILPRLGLVPVDPNRIQQAIWNLLSNAIKFTPPGGQVALQASRRDSSVQVAVSDTGIGIAAEFLPHVFDRLRQAQQPVTTRAHGGLGLGLSIVRYIVEMHGGTVEAESDGIGRGATFRISLPVRPPESRAPDRIEAMWPDDEREPPPDLLNGLSILVVEDDAESRALLTFALQQFGADVRTADSAAAALQVLQSESADILISDISMPGEDGLSLIRQVRSLGTSVAAIPAIALTGLAMEADRLKIIEAGFWAYGAKPMAPAHLVLAVARLAGRT